LYRINEKKYSRLGTPSSSHRTIDRELQRNLLNNLKGKKPTFINGIDPGIKSTATMTSVTLQSTFESINRYSILSSITPEEDHSSLDIGTAEKNITSSTLNVTPAFINNVTFSKNHQRKRENKSKKNIPLKQEYLSKQKLTRKIRLAKANSKIISNYRQKSNNYFHFFGNWG
jgi:hypothetical protein